MFIGMAPICWQNQAQFLVLFTSYVLAANLDLSSSLPFTRSLHFNKATSFYNLRSTGMS